MKVKLLAGLVFCAFFAGAQNWCAPGSTWYFSWFYFQTSGFVQYKYNEDDVINNIPCKIIKGTSTVNGEFSNNLNYTYSSGDTVYFFNFNSHIFQPYFYFNAHAGDTIQVAEHKGSVDSTGTMVVNDRTLRYYYFDIPDSICGGSYLSYSDKVVEDIGLLSNNLIPAWSCFTDRYYYQFQCYYNDSMFYSINDTAHSCDYMFTGIENIYRGFKISISPNPLSDYLFVDIDEVSGTLNGSVFDITGANVARFEITSPHTQIPVNNLPSGMYFVQIKGGDNAVIKRIVIQH